MMERNRSRRAKNKRVRDRGNTSSPRSTRSHPRFTHPPTGPPSSASVPSRSSVQALLEVLSRPVPAVVSSRCGARDERPGVQKSINERPPAPADGLISAFSIHSCPHTQCKHQQPPPPPTMQARALLWALAGAFVVQVALALNDYHNVFCGKANCYELLGVAEVNGMKLRGVDGSAVGGNAWP